MKTVGIVASGPSATHEDAQKLREIVDILIAVNDSWRLCRNFRGPRDACDVVYGTDSRWWKWALPDVVRDFDGELWTQIVQWPEDPTSLGINCLQSEHKPGLCTEPGKIYTGQNSGFAAINLAYHLLRDAGGLPGRIILLGYDMQLQDQQRHWFDDDARPGNLNVDSNYRNFMTCFSTIKPADYQLEIVNATRKTALECFPRVKLDELYSRLHPAERSTENAVALCMA